jgi:capsular polysaccharide biosynthesis protein
MSDDFTKYLKYAKTKRAIAIIGFASVVILILNETSIPIEIDNNKTTIPIIPSSWSNIPVAFAIGTFVTLSLIILGQTYLSPEIKEFVCLKCKGKMSTKQLVCDNCESTFTIS